MSHSLMVLVSQNVPLVLEVARIICGQEHFGQFSISRGIGAVWFCESNDLFDIFSRIAVSMLSWYAREKSI